MSNRAEPVDWALKINKIPKNQNLFRHGSRFCLWQLDQNVIVAKLLMLNHWKLLITLMEKRGGGNVMVDGSIITLTGKTRLVHFGGNVSVESSWDSATSSDSISRQSGISQDDNTQSHRVCFIWDYLQNLEGRRMEWPSNSAMFDQHTNIDQNVNI